jgi:hypothetical protein
MRARLLPNGPTSEVLGMLNAMVCGPAPAALAFKIACRKEPVPESLVLVTVKVAAWLACAASNQPPTTNNVFFNLILKLATSINIKNKLDANIIFSVLKLDHILSEMALNSFEWNVFSSE